MIVYIYGSERNRERERGGGEGELQSLMYYDVSVIATDSGAAMVCL